MITWDKLNDAIIGTGCRCGMEEVFVYSYDKILDILITEDEMTEREAIDYIEYNIAGLYVGELTPILVRNLDEVENIFG